MLQRLKSQVGSSVSFDTLSSYLYTWNFLGRVFFFLLPRSSPFLFFFGLLMDGVTGKQRKNRSKTLRGTAKVKGAKKKAEKQMWYTSVVERGKGMPCGFDREAKRIYCDLVGSISRFCSSQCCIFRSANGGQWGSIACHGIKTQVSSRW